MTNELCHDAIYLFDSKGYLFVHVASRSVCLRKLLGVCLYTPCHTRLDIVKTQFSEFSLSFSSFGGQVYWNEITRSEVELVYYGEMKSQEVKTNCCFCVVTGQEH